MLARIVRAVREAAAGRVIVVGPARPGLEVRVVREEPPGAGPVAALRVGLEEVKAPWVAVLAADLPFLNGEHVKALLVAARDAVVATGASPSPGAVLVDETGREQWLAGCWRTAVLREAIKGYQDGSMRGLFGPLGPVMVRLPADEGGPPPWLDCDTPDDLRRARAWCSPDRVGGKGRDERA